MPTAEDVQVFPADLEPPLVDVISEFALEESRGRIRQAAELAYAIAVRMQAEGRVRDAAEYAKRCVALISTQPSSTIEQVTSTRTKAGGVLLPELLHEGVVRSRLGHLLDS
jgi:hypothetical protein